ncbi:MAG: FadR family transcriptional regulator [Desulfobacterales bacterium]|nr:FadR family transcriptional regulator [Desulfobacterales bacterium]
MESNTDSQPLFRAARQNRIFQDVVEQIQDAIIDGRLRAGDKLPAERELKDLLKTSRSTLREALRVLEQKGLIEIKLGVGGGAVVRSVSSDQVAESLDLLIRSQKVSLNHLAEFREGVEGDVTAIAAKRARPADIRKLRDLVEKARKHADRGAVEDFLKADKTFHLTLARISQNPVYVSVLKTIHENIHRYYERYLAMEAREMRENFQDLNAIVDAVEAKQPEEARTIAQSHVRRFNQYMKKGKHHRVENATKPD